MENCTAEFERPADFVLVLNGKDNTRLLVQDRYNPIHANYEEDITGKDPYIDPPARDSAVFENISMVLRDVIGQYQDADHTVKTLKVESCIMVMEIHLHLLMILGQILSATEMMWKLESHGSC